MNNSEKEIRTPKMKAHMCDKVYRGGQPVGLVKSRSLRDTMTACEYTEALYGKPVRKIIFMDGDELTERDTAF